MKHSTTNGEHHIKKMFKDINLTKGRTKIKPILVVVFWLIIWQISYVIIGKDLILPSPFNAFHALWTLVLTKTFYINIGATMYRVISGILISAIVGTITAILAYFFRLVRDLLGFMVLFLKSTPVMAVIIFAILWLTSGNVPVFTCFLMCYPVIYTNILSGLDNMDKKLLEMSAIYQLRLNTRIKHLYIPSVIPYAKPAISLISGLSWKTVVAAEVLSSPKFSMGYNLLDAKIYLETDLLFAWIIAIVTLSLIFENIVNRLLFSDGKKGNKS